MAKRIRLVGSLPDDYLDSIETQFITDAHCNAIIGGEDTDVLKPDGSLLLKLRTKAVSKSVANRARPALRLAGSTRSEKRRFYSAIAGYFDEPDCRTTAFTRDHLDEWADCLPFIREVDAVYGAECHDHYSLQRRIADATAQEYVIGNTAFTTMTVNLWDADHDARTYVHRDRGDLPEGFGVITTLTRGAYTGGLLVFPKFQIGVDLRSRDVLLCDVHELHGNTQVVGAPGWERISCVLYFRTNMSRC